MRLTADGKPIPKPAAKREVWDGGRCRRLPQLLRPPRHQPSPGAKSFPASNSAGLWRFRRQEIEALFEERNPENPR